MPSAFRLKSPLQAIKLKGRIGLATLPVFVGLPALLLSDKMTEYKQEVMFIKYRPSDYKPAPRPRAIGRHNSGEKRDSAPTRLSGRPILQRTRYLISTAWKNLYETNVVVVNNNNPFYVAFIRPSNTSTLRPSDSFSSASHSFL